jgi:hypothetical protein
MTHTVESLMTLADRYVQCVIDDKACHTRETLIDLQNRRAYLEFALNTVLAEHEAQQQEPQDAKDAARAIRSQGKK